MHRIFFRPILAALTAILLLAGIDTPRAESVDPSSLAVAGVKLGMTPDDAIAAARTFDGAYDIAKLYMTEPLTSYNQTGEQKPTGANADVAYLNSITAINEGNTKPQISCPGGMTGAAFGSCNTIYFDDYEKVTIWLSPIPGQERVIAVVREKQFIKNADHTPPSVASLRQAMLAKYPNNLTYDVDDDNGAMVFGIFFDQLGRVMSSTAAKNKQLLDYRGGHEGGLPNTAGEGGPIGLSASIKQSPDNKGIATNFAVGLYNSDALFKSIGQSKIYMEKAIAAKNAKEIGNATKNGSQTKF